MSETDTELVVHTDDRPMDAEFLVASVADSTKNFTEGGGRLVRGPFDIQIGKCAVLLDPWGNRIVIVDMTKGMVKVDAEKNVI